MTAVMYGTFAFAIAMVGFALASLYNSPEERMNRESSIYNYAAFIAYMILAVIGFVIVYKMYQRGYLANMLIGGIAGPVATGFGGPFIGYLTSLAIGSEARREGYLQPFPEETDGTDTQEQTNSTHSTHSTNSTHSTHSTPVVKERVYSSKKHRRQIGYGRYHA